MQGADTDVLIGLVHHPLVDLIRDAQDVPLAAQIRDKLQLVATKHLSQWIVRRVEDDRLGLLGEQGLHRCLVELPLG